MKNRLLRRCKQSSVCIITTIMLCGLFSPVMRTSAASTLISQGSLSATTVYKLYDTDGDGEADNITFEGDGKNTVGEGYLSNTVSNKIKTVSFSNSMTCIGEYLLGTFSSVDNIVIPSSVTTIEEGAFEHCYGLTHITIPDSVTKISYNAFWACNKLAEIEIPANTYLEEDVFSNDIVIIGDENSPAHAYAIENGLTFRSKCNHTWNTKDIPAQGNRIGIRVTTCTKCGQSESTATSVTGNYPVTGSVAANRKDLSTNVSTKHATDDDFWSESIKLTSFVDKNGNLHVASYSNGTLTIQRFDSNLNYISSINISNPLQVFGNIIGDENGYYYVAWGAYDSNSANIETLRVSKYNNSGALVGECKMLGKALPDVYGGAQWPFEICDSGIAINSAGILTIYLPKKRYDGHQSNYVIWVKTADMTRVVPSKDNVAFASHSFYHDAIATKDGGYLYAAQGDGNPRGFVVTKVGSDLKEQAKILTFHFREGANRENGGNETYAQLGGIIETDGAYVLCGASERTLSRADSPAGGYCGHNEKRDLFIQVMKHGLHKGEGFAGAASELNTTDLRIQGETRRPTGTPNSPSANIHVLNGSETDNGIIWLTALSNDSYVANPKIVNIGGDKFAVLWEELSYATKSGNTYYEILKDNGETVVEKTLITNAQLCESARPKYNNGKIYWAVANEGLKAVFSLPVDTSEQNVMPDSTVDPSTLHCKWFYQGGKAYWYEHGVRQGTYNDPNGVMGDGTIRGREICDMESAGWYWLDSVYNGAKAVNKEVWMPYIYQQEKTWGDDEIRMNAQASGNMAAQVERDIKAGTGKWVRYDANGAMYKGWYTVEGQQATIYPSQAGNTYYYDPKTGLMAKGDLVIDGVAYHFDEITGVLQR